MSSFGPLSFIDSATALKQKFTFFHLKLNTLLLSIGLITCAIAFTSAAFLVQLGHEKEKTADATLEQGIKTFWTLLNSKGEIRIINGKLLAGDYPLNGNFEIPDKVRDIFGGTATIFMGDVRISTNVGLTENGERAVGTHLAGPAHDAIFKENRPFKGETSIMGIPYITAYDPIRDTRGQPIGAVYVGIRKSEFFASYEKERVQIIATAVFADLLFVVLSSALLWQRKKYFDKLRASENTYRTLFESSNEGILLTKDKILACNDRACCLLGLDRNDIIGRKPEELLPLNSTGVESLQETTHSWRFRRNDGKQLDTEVSLKQIDVAEGRAVQLMVRDVTEHKQTTSLLSAEKLMMEMIVQGRPLLDVLSHICLTFEEICNETLCSILLVDAEGTHLVQGAAPSLPAEYCRAVNGTRIGPLIGSCGTAAYAGKRSIASDIATDPCWEKYKQLPLRYGLRACWSNPIFSSSDEVLGTFAIYYHSPRQPELYELNLIDRASSLASIAIQHTRAREALHDAFFKQQAILDNVPDMVWMKDVDGRFLTVNEAFARMSGFEASELVGKSDLDVWPLDLAQQYRADDACVVETGNKTRKEELLEDPAGNRRWIETIKTPIYRENGVIIGTTGIARDIDVRKRGEAALRESEERFHQFFTQNWDAVMLLTKETLDVVDMNPAMVQLFGYELDELQRLGPLYFVAPGSAQGFMEFFPNVAERVDSIMENAEGISKGGTKITISVRARLISLREQNIIYCSFRDISERMRLEAEQREAQSRLIHANKMTSLGMLVSGIAHEINNPNQYISVNASLVSDIWQHAVSVLNQHQTEHGTFHLKGLPFDQIRETTPRLLKGIEEGSRRINTIVDNLKDFARDNSGQKYVLFDLNSVIHAAAMILTHHIHKYTDQFRLELADHLPKVKGKPQLIEQVVINLITNALEALPNRKCSVVLSSAFDSESDHLVLHVRDEGKGMTKAIMERMTEPFFTTRLNEGGTGLGLSISASILNEHQGTLVFESSHGIGTTATMKLRAASAPGGSEATPEHEGDRA